MSAAYYLTLDCRDGVHAACATCSCRCHGIVPQFPRKRHHGKVYYAVRAVARFITYLAIAVVSLLVIQWVIILLVAAFDAY